MLRRFELADSALGLRVRFGTFLAVPPTATWGAWAQAETQAPIIGVIQGVALNDPTDPFAGGGAFGLPGNDLRRDQASVHLDGGTWNRLRAVPKGTAPQNQAM